MKITHYDGIDKTAEYEAVNRIYMAQDNVLHMIETCGVSKGKHLTIELEQEDIKDMILQLARMLK